MSLILALAAWVLPLWEPVEVLVLISVLHRLRVRASLCSSGAASGAAQYAMASSSRSEAWSGWSVWNTERIFSLAVQQSATSSQGSPSSKARFARRTMRGRVGRDPCLFAQQPSALTSFPPNWGLLYEAGTGVFVGVHR